jgi:hypothetical protein
VTTDEPTEPDDAGDHEVPGDLVQLHEVIEWDNALKGTEPNGPDQ